MDRNDIQTREGKGDATGSPPASADEFVRAPDRATIERAKEPDVTPAGDERSPPDPAAIRSEDTEPYVGLQYVARLFKIAAMVVIVALVAEIVAAFALEGMSVVLPLLAEIVQGGVLAAILWGAGDLTLLLIDVGHDVRAARVLLGRLSARIEPDPETQRQY